MKVLYLKCSPQKQDFCLTNVVDGIVRYCPKILIAILEPVLT